MLKIIVVILLMANFAASRRIQHEKIKLTKVLISTGDATGTTEIIDLVNHEDATCENLQYDYPIPTRHSVFLYYIAPVILFLGYHFRDLLFQFLWLLQFSFLF